MSGPSQYRVSRKATPRGFDFTFAMRALCADVTERLRELQHIQLDLVALSFAQSRNPALYGLQASLTPLRFEGGSRYSMQDGSRVTSQRLLDEQGRELLYILSFYMPRFMDLDFREKLVTIFHELWHISPRFDGDIRRHAGRCYAHTSSQAAYDQHMGQLVNRYLTLEPPNEMLRFLEFDFHQLERKFGKVYGFRVPRPKLLLA